MELGTWSWQLDKLLVTGAAAGYTRRAAYEAARAELQETQHRMTQAQEWLSGIRASLGIGKRTRILRRKTRRGH